MLQSLLSGRDWALRRLCLAIDSNPEPDSSAVVSNEPPAEDEPTANSEGTAALLLLAQDAVADERERGRALDTKTASLVGATGLILSVNVTLGRPLLETQLGWLGQALVVLFFVVAVIALFLALVVGIVGVLMPQEYRGLDRAQLRAFNTPASQAMTGCEVHIAMLGALSTILDHDRPVNDCKAHLTTIVGFLLALGFTGVAGEALTLGVHAAGI